MNEGTLLQPGVEMEYKGARRPHPDSQNGLRVPFQCGAEAQVNVMGWLNSLTENPSSVNTTDHR